MQHSSPQHEQSSPAPASSLAYGSTLLHWQAPEHEPLELGHRSRLFATFLLIAIVAWALYTNSALMAITFILIGVTGYLALNREPEIVNFSITTKGILAGRNFYEYEDIESFHFYEEPPFDNLLSLKTNGHLVSHVHVPIMTQSREDLYKVLSHYVPEDKHDPSMVDIIEKMLHI